MNELCAKLVGALLVGAVVLAPMPSLASEPSNNNSPWSFSEFGFRGDVSLFASNKPVGQGNGWVGTESILPTNDVDYHLMSCQGRVVKSVGISSFSNDLDIQVYDQAGNFLGSSESVTATESVNVAPFSKPGVFVRVYGFGGATSASYQISVFC